MSSCILDAVVDADQDGRLFCDTGSGQLQKCKLQWTSSSQKCMVLQNLKGHMYGPNCGLEKVPHEDHYDYLVDGELHHVVEKGLCCPKQCVKVKNSDVVSHGLVEIIRKGCDFISNCCTSQNHTAVEIQTLKPEVVTTTRIVAEGICCPSEVPVVQRTLGPIPGVYDLDVSVVTKTVVVEHDAAQVSPGLLVSALNGANLSASLASNYKINQNLKTSWKSWIPPIHILLCFLLLMLALAQYTDIQLQNFRLEDLRWIALGSILVGIWPILKKAYGAFRACFIDIHILMTLAVVGAIALGEYAEGAAVVFLFGLADWLEGKCTKHASNALAAVLYLQPDKAIIASTYSEVDVDEVTVGEILVVKPGCKVPIDGVVCRGQTLIDESMLTGESQPVFKTLGNSVMSGTLNTGVQAIEIKTNKLSVDSTACRIGNLIEEATRKKSPTERIVNNVAKYYTPLLVLATVLVIVVPLILKVDNAKDWVVKGLVLLVSACPCALVLSTPVTIVCGLARAAQKGVVIKGAQYLETLGRCRFMSFDKTGTLTRGQVELVYAGIFKDSRSEQEIIELAASLESHSSHPLATAVLGYAAARGYNKWVGATVCESIPGQGIYGEVNTELLSAFVGNQSMVQNLCPEVDVCMLDAQQSREKKGETVVFVGCNGELWGYLALKDKPRSEAKQALKDIQKFGVQVGMMTGDRKLVAYYVAEEMGIDKEHVGAELLPEQKLMRVEDIKKIYKVCHIGDGVNDGPALATADVGVAMGVAGSAVAIETADIALFTSDLRQLAFALRLSRAAVRTILINVIFAVFIKISVIIIAFTIGVNLWVAVLADVGSCITVILFSMTILHIDSKYKDSKEFCYANKKDENYYNENSGRFDIDESCCAKKNQSKKKNSKEKNSSCCDSKNFSENAIFLSGIIVSDEEAMDLHGNNDHQQSEKNLGGMALQKNQVVGKNFFDNTGSNIKSKCYRGKKNKNNFMLIKKSRSQNAIEKSCCDTEELGCFKSKNEPILYKSEVAVKKSCCASKRSRDMDLKNEPLLSKSEEAIQKSCCSIKDLECVDQNKGPLLSESKEATKKSCCSTKKSRCVDPKNEPLFSKSEEKTTPKCCNKKSCELQDQTCQKTSKKHSLTYTSTEGTELNSLD